MSVPSTVNRDEKRSWQLRRQLQVLLKQQISEYTAAEAPSIAPLLHAIAAAPVSSRLPPSLRQLLRIGWELSFHFVSKKLKEKVARKVARLLALLPIKSVVALFTRGNNATRVVKSVSRPPALPRAYIARHVACVCMCMYVCVCLCGAVCGECQGPPPTAPALVLHVLHRPWPSCLSSCQAAVVR